MLLIALRAGYVASAAARPADRPEKRHPPRNVPSSARSRGCRRRRNPRPHRRRIIRARAARRRPAPATADPCGARRGSPRQDGEPDGKQGAVARIQQPVRRRHPHDLVGGETAGGPDGGQLRILAQPGGKLPVPGTDQPVQVSGVNELSARQVVHLPGQRGGGPGLQEVDAVVQEPLQRRVAARFQPRGQQPDILAGEVRVLLRSGQSELLQGNRPVEDKPGMGMSRGQDVAQGTEGVEAGKQGRGSNRPSHPATGPTARQDPDAMPRPDRGMVEDALRVVPHPVAIDEAAAGPAHGRQEVAVDGSGHSTQHRRRRPATGPLFADRIVVAADPAARHHDGGGRSLKNCRPYAGTIVHPAPRRWPRAARRGRRPPGPRS